MDICLGDNMNFEMGLATNRLLKVVNVQILKFNEQESISTIQEYVDILERINNIIGDG